MTENKQQPIQKVLSDYVVENANLKIQIETLIQRVKELEEVKSDEGE